LKRRFSSGYSRRLTSQGHGGPVPAVGCLLIFEAERRPRNGVQPGHRDYSAADLADSIGASFDSAQRIVDPSQLTRTPFGIFQEFVFGAAGGCAVRRIEGFGIRLLKGFGFGAQAPDCKLIAACGENSPVMFEQLGYECHEAL